MPLGKAGLATCLATVTALDYRPGPMLHGEHQPGDGMLVRLTSVVAKKLDATLLEGILGGVATWSVP